MDDIHNAVRQIMSDPESAIPNMREMLAEKALHAPADEILDFAKMLWGLERLSTQQAQADIEAFLEGDQ